MFGTSLSAAVWSIFLIKSILHDSDLPEIQLELRVQETNLLAFEYLGHKMAVVLEHLDGDVEGGNK